MAKLIREVLNYDDEDIEAIRKEYGVDESAIERDVEILKTWMRQQPHLPPPSDDPLDRKFLENALLMNKFRVEKTKKKLENYYTLRGLYREYYQERNDIVPSEQKSLELPLPVLSPVDKSRIFLFRIDPNPDNFAYKDFIKYLNLYLELLARYDYAKGHTLIFDGAGFTLDHLKKLSVSEIARQCDLNLNGYSGKVCGLEVINPPRFLQIVLGVFKLALPEKMFQKIRIHDNLDSLHLRVPKECLPSDLGGDLESTDRMLSKWDHVFEEYSDFFSRNYHNISDENLRIGDIKNQGFFGVDGTFKKLNLD